MKKLGVMMLSILIGFSSVSMTAKDSKSEKVSSFSERYRFAQPIVFIERGVEFMIFPDGSFDFIDNNLISVRDNRPNKRRMAVQVNSVPGRNHSVRYAARSPRTFVGYNRYGEINQINDIYIDYDRAGKVRRIGSVDIGYQRGNNRLRYVGNLKVNYNHWGEIVHVKGHVNRYNAHLNQSLGHNRQEFFDCDNYDDDYYYYKKDGKRKKHKKRRKSSRR